jgi:hypothetical protein
MKDPGVDEGMLPEAQRILGSYPVTLSLLSTSTRIIEFSVTALSNICHRLIENPGSHPAACPAESSCRRTRFINDCATSLEVTPPNAIFEDVTAFEASFELVTAEEASFELVTAEEAILALVTEASFMSFVPSPFVPTHWLQTTSPAMVTASACICPPSGVIALTEEKTSAVAATMARTHVKETLYSLMVCKRRVSYKKKTVTD